MAKFKDNAGREWIIAITIADLRRVKERTGVKIDALSNDGFAPLAELMGDIVKLIDIVWVLVEKQALALAPPLTSEAFGESLGGDSLSDLVEAFIAAFADFSPPRLRDAIKKIVEKGRVMSEAASKKIMEAIDAVNLESIIGIPAENNDTSSGVRLA